MGSEHQKVEKRLIYIHSTRRTEVHSKILAKILSHFWFL